jgi:hypothetical protein
VGPASTPYHPQRSNRYKSSSGLRPATDVTLLSLLTSEDRAAVGQDGWIVQADPSSYGKTRSWGQWLRAIAPWAQGIAWPSERGLGEPVAVLFGDRIPAQGVQPCLEMATDLDDEKGAAFLNTALATWSLRIRPPRPGKSGLDAPPPSEPGTIPPVPGLIDFDDFFRSSFPVVRRAMWAITQDWALADDVAQAAMMAAFNSWDVVAEHPEPRGWVIVTASWFIFSGTGLRTLPA